MLIVLALSMDISESSGAKGREEVGGYTPFVTVSTLLRIAYGPSRD